MHERGIEMAHVYEVPLRPLGRAVFLTSAHAFIAGIVDVVGFMALFGLFTSHFTGNFIVIGEELVGQSLRLVAQLIAIPIFLAVVAGVRLFLIACERRGHSGFRACLAMQAVLLAACMAAGILASPITDPASIGAIITAQLGVAAMAIQNANCRLIFPGHPPTTVMTTNLTQICIDFVDMYRRVPGVSEMATVRFDRTAPIIAAFCAGVVVGAYGYVLASFWCLLLPVAVLVVILALAPRGNALAGAQRAA
jgi:uncharacterized membrane protein YoaK (UPF0700 family)